MKKIRKKNDKVNFLAKNLYLKLSFIMLFSILFITVGFSALSTTLTMDGSAKFVPVGMIRVMSINQNSLTDVTEIDRGYTLDSINVIIDFDEETGIAVYDVNITNLGQTDKKLTQIIEDIYTNSDVEYELSGLDINDVIEAGESRNFTITFKYKQGVTPESERLNAKLQFVFDDYESNTFPVVFSQEGACTFNGENGTITGSECSDYANQKYIDTGIKLYDTDNWQKDYEIGFTIDSYNPSQQVKQAVFVNAKYEKESLKWPGLVFRRLNTTANFELTQSINNGTKAVAELSGYSLPLDVKILRVSGVVYYSINNGPLVTLQDMNNFNQQFDVTTWFGAAPDESGNAMRHVKATMSNMYIKLGTYVPKQYTIRFNANGGTVSEPVRTVPEFNILGALPTPTNSDEYMFAGWFTDLTYQTRVDPNSVVMEDAEYYAKWVLTKNIEVNGTYYDSIAEAIADNAGTQITIVLHDDVNERVVLSAGSNVTLDLNGHTMTNPELEAVITNNGNLTIRNGTIRNEVTFSVLDNNQGGTLVIDNVTLINTSTKQAVYNNGGHVTIQGNSYLRTDSSQRAAVQNLRSGTTIITGGTIEATNYYAVKNEAGTLIIGSNDGSIDTSTPVIIGKTNGITSSPNYSIYDGIIKGTTAAVNDVNKITNIESNSEIVTGTESINGVTYKTLYLNAISNEP